MDRDVNFRRGSPAEDIRAKSSPQRLTPARPRQKVQHQQDGDVASKICVTVQFKHLKVCRLFSFFFWHGCLLTNVKMLLTL